MSKDAILGALDAMAMYKLNKLHFHLSDDEGWRLEIPGLPELTAVRLHGGPQSQGHQLEVRAKGCLHFTTHARFCAQSSAREK